MPPTIYWSHERCIDAIQEWARGNGDLPPTVGDWKLAAPDHPNFSVIVRRFGSWNAGLEASGFTPRRKKITRKRGGVVWTEDAILAAIRVWYREHGRAPSSFLWRKASPTHPSSQTVYERFGSFPKAVALAGFRPPRRGFAAYWTRERVIAAFLDWVLYYGTWPTWADWERPCGEPLPPAERWRGRRWPYVNTVLRLFGTWTAAQRAAGRASLREDVAG